MTGAVISLIPLLIVILIIGTAMAAASRPDLARVSIGAVEVVVQPLGVLKIFTLRSRIVIPAASIRQVSVVSDPLDGLPGLQAGTFVRGGVRSFWLCGRGPEALRLALSDGPYDYVIVQMGNCRELLDQIRAAGIA
jgi:hypothetical protein